MECASAFLEGCFGSMECISVFLEGCFGSMECVSAFLEGCLEERDIILTQKAAWKKETSFLHILNKFDFMLLNLFL